MRYTEILTEGPERNVGLGKIVAASIKAKANLGPEGRHAIDAWNVNWDTGSLEKAYQANSALTLEVDQAFAPVRKALQATYGPTITLYRGQRNYKTEDLTPNRVLFSWTSDINVATKFAINKRLMREFTDAEVTQAIQQFHRAGFCKFAGHTFKLMRTDPDYYMIYKGQEEITDGDVASIEQDFKDEQAERVAYNQKAKENGTVMSEDVDINLIVWMTNELNCKEFIVKLNPLR